VFPEAVTELSLYTKFAEAAGVPVLANITEFGVTPLYNLHQLNEAKVRVALYPLSAFRAMSAAALTVYKALRSEGTQAGVLDVMQSRKDLYHYLDYEAYEQRMDRLFQKESAKAEFQE
jgi:methylisocitrate lyase